MTKESTVYSLSPRLTAMRERVIHTPQEISLVRARAITEAVKVNHDLPRGIQFALGLKDSFRRLPISISDDEYIIGALTEKFKGAILYPELKSDFLSKELDNFGQRELDRFAITDSEKQELRESILPYWDGNSAFDDMLSRQSEKTLYGMRNIFFVINNDFSGANHLASIDYGRVLESGFNGISREAGAAQEKIPESDPDAGKKRSFYQSVILSAEAITEFAGRYSRLALELASNAGSPDRAGALREIAEITARVPAEPARTLREAVQSFWFTYLALMNLDGGMEIPLGRLDQLLYPYYRRDLDEGRLTTVGAQELVAELFIKINQLIYLNEYAATKVMDGNNQRRTLTLGGVDAAGNDAVNQMSFLILEVIGSLSLTQPNVAVRLHPNTPEPFRKQVTRLMTNGANLIQVFNDEVNIAGFLQLGFPVEAARDYIITGCVQPLPAGTYGPTCSGFINGPKVLELVLNGGKPFLSLSGEEEDLPAPQFESYEELREAFKAQLKSVTEEIIAAMRVVGEVQHRLLPNPILSALMDGTLASGRDAKAGGARYNQSGIDLVGLGTLADSLAALKEIVFEQKLYPLEEVVEWLKADFAGYEPQRQLLLNRTPKYGNDDPRADAVAGEIVDWIAGILQEHRTYRGGMHALGLHSETHHIIQGVLVAATPDGRLAGEMLSPGSGPTSGMDQQGPTASMCSMTAVNYTKVMGGASSNMRFNPTLLRTESQAEQFGALLKAYFKLGGQHLQINVVDAETLRDAQQNPEQYQDLIVRVAGYSARFVELTPGTQEEIIRRSEMNICG